MPDITRVMNVDVSGLATRSDGELASAHNDPGNSQILLAACRIVINGYKAEISRSQDTSLFVQAAYQRLRRFLEREFERQSRAA
jgi:hypothetical protein